MKGDAMYTKEQLARYPYFAGVLEEIGVESVLDPLTGIVARGHMLWFVQDLMERDIPFSFAILDLDNFKFINDTFGHHVGDGVLVRVAADLAAYLDGYGVAGRFGGDEMLIVNLRDLAYDDKKRFFRDLYEGRVLRKNIPVEDCRPFVTGTIGCATFPHDARDFDGLFALIDKTLYRGKTKGRNCHIIYVEEKHKNIEIRKLAKRGMYTTFHSVIRQYEMVPGLKNKLHNVTPLLMEELQISDLYYVGLDGVMHSVRSEDFREAVPDVGNVLAGEDLFAANSLEGIEKPSPIFYEVLRRMEVETVVIVRVGMDMETDGWLICAEPHSRRIWQEAECAMLYFLAKLLAASIRIDGEKL